MSRNCVTETMVTVQCPCPNCGSKATRTYFSSREAFYHRCAIESLRPSGRRF